MAPCLAICSSESRLMVTVICLWLTGLLSSTVGEGGSTRRIQPVVRCQSCCISPFASCKLVFGEALLDCGLEHMCGYSLRLLGAAAEGGADQYIRVGMALRVACTCEARLPRHLRFVDAPQCEF